MFGEEYKYEAPHYAVFSNISLRTLFSNTLSMCTSLNVRDQVSHPYRTTGKIIILYILIFMFLGSRGEDKRMGLLRE
jgi:hypothetical protein